MTDHYKISLGILKQLLEESDNSHWANWINEDIQFWESKKDVKHHLGAYGGMGSINDLFVGGSDKLGIWNNQVFVTIKTLSWSLAKQRINSAPTTPDFYQYGTGQMSGWRCRNCGHSRLDENQIEQYLSFKYLPQLITDLIRKDKLENLVPISNWIDNDEVKSVRIRIKDYLTKSEIEFSKFQSWLKTCPKCKSDDICVYRWEWNDTENTIIESKDNLKIKKRQHSTMAIFNKGFIAKLKDKMLKRILAYFIILNSLLGCNNIVSKKNDEPIIQGDITREKIQRNSIDSDANIFNNKWPVQFMIDAKSFEPTLNALNSISKCKIITDFTNHEITPANVHSWNAKMILFNDTIDVSKMTYSDWKLPIYSFGWEESFNNVKSDSKIKRIENALEEYQIKYKLVDYLKE